MLEFTIALAIGVTLVVLVLHGRRGSGEPMRGSTTAPSAQVERDPTLDPRDARLPDLSLTQRDTGFFGTWLEGTSRGCRVAFQRDDKCFMIIAGDFDADEEQLSETYVSQVGDARPLPRDGSVQRLAVAIGPEGAALDDRFYLNATGGSYSQLRLPAVQHALLQLSDSIVEVALFESGGVELWSDATATAESLARDLDVAVELTRALAAAHSS